MIDDLIKLGTLQKQVRIVSSSYRLETSSINISESFISNKLLFL